MTSYHEFISMVKEGFTNLHSHSYSHLKKQDNWTSFGGQLPPHQELW